MQTISSILNSRTGFTARPFSLRQLFTKLQASTAAEAIASYKIDDFHRRTGGSFGPLGIPAGKITRDGNGSYIRAFQLGRASLKTLDGTVQAQTMYEASVLLSAVKCFGTAGAFLTNDDTVYAVISLININPNSQGSDQLVTTFHTPVQENVEGGHNGQGGSIIFESTTIGNIAPSGTGLAIHVALWRHVDGNIDDITNKIHSALNDAVNKAAAAMAANSAAADDTSTSGGTFGDVTQWSIGGIKPVDILTLGLAGLIAKFFADKLLGQNVYWVAGGDIAALSDQTNYTNSVYHSPDLRPDIPVNWPPLKQDNPLYTEGGGGYKAYFLVQVQSKPLLVTPASGG